MKILFWRDPGLAVGRAQGYSACLLRVLGKLDHRGREISGLWKKSLEWRPFFVSTSAGVQENGNVI